MRFYCAQCQAKYNVEDSRLPAGKVIRITCKKCNSVMRISLGKTIEGAVMQSDSDSASAQSPKKDNNDVGRWYILIGQDRQGPFNHSQIIEKCQSQTIDQFTYVWRKGMANWQRLNEIEEFANEVKKLGTASWRVVKPISEEEEKAFAKRQEDQPSQLNTKPIAASPQELPNEFSFSAFDDLMNASSDDIKGKIVNNDGSTTTAPSMAATPIPAPMPMEPVSSDYYNAPPGEATQIFFATAGIYKRRKNQKIAAISIACVMIALIGFIIMDANGLIQLPGMGAIYEKTDMLDPNKERGVERIQVKLKRKDLTPEEREALRKKLHLYEEVDVASLKQVKDSKRGKGKGKHRHSTASANNNNNNDLYQDEIKKDAPVAKGTQADLTASMFNDNRKKDTKVELNLNTKVSTSDLPAGLTQDAITGVITDSKKSLSLCTAEAMKAGEKLSGRMEVEFTIQGSGKVSEVTIATKKFKDTRFASCITRTVQRWTFPRFNGEPVTVSYPIIITLGM